MAADTLHLLLVGADNDSIESFHKAIQPYTAFPCVCARTGAEALAILWGARGFERLPYPFIVVVDLDMPDRAASCFLHTLRQDLALKGSVVCGLAHSWFSDTVLTADQMGIAACIPKRIVNGNFASVVALLDLFRFNRFPPDPR